MSCLSILLCYGHTRHRHCSLNLLLAGQGQAVAKKLCCSTNWQQRDVKSSLLPCLQVRSWDVETGVQRDALNSSKAVYAVDTAPGTASVVALAGADKAWRLWDMRQRRGEGLVRPTSLHCPSMCSQLVMVFLTMCCPASQGLKAYPSHKDWITGIAWCPTSATHLATVSHDKTCKLWDTRSNIPLHTLEGHTDKVRP